MKKSIFRFLRVGFPGNLDGGSYNIMRREMQKLTESTYIGRTCEERGTVFRYKEIIQVSFGNTIMIIKSWGGALYFGEMVMIKCAEPFPGTDSSGG